MLKERIRTVFVNAAVITLWICCTGADAPRAVPACTAAHVPATATTAAATTTTTPAAATRGAKLGPATHGGSWARPHSQLAAGRCHP